MLVFSVIITGTSLLPHGVPRHIEYVLDGSSGVYYGKQPSSRVALLEGRSNGPGSRFSSGSGEGVAYQTVDPARRSFSIRSTSSSSAGPSRPPCQSLPPKNA